MRPPSVVEKGNSAFSFIPRFTFFFFSFFLFFFFYVGNSLENEERGLLFSVAYAIIIIVDVMWDYSSVGQSATLTSWRSMVRAHLIPRIPKALRCKAFGIFVSQKEDKIWDKLGCIMGSGQLLGHIAMSEALVS